MSASPPAERVVDVTTPVWRQMAVFLVPLMASNILQTLSSTLNSVYVGRILGVQALAALSAFFPVLFFMISFLIGISSGSTVLIAQAYGARDDLRMKAVAGTTLTLTLAIGIAIAILGSLFARDFLLVLGTPRDIIADAEQYARVIFISLPLLFLYLVYTTFMRGTGDARTPFYFLIISTALSMLITPALLLGWFGLPRMGVASAAIGGTAASGTAFLAMLAYLGAIRHPLALDRAMFAGMRPRLDLVTAIVRIGIPTGIQLVLISLSEVAVLSFVNAYGSSATAAYGAVNQVVSYVQFPAVSIGIASSIFGAQTIGAGRIDRLHRVIRTGVTLNYLIGGVLVILVYTFSWSILGWFLTSSRTLAIAHGLLTITLWSYVLFGNNSVLSGVMRASGTVFWPTAISVFAIWGVEVPAAYLLSHRFGLGLDGIWIGYPVAFAVGLALQTAYFLLVWQKRSIRPLHENNLPSGSISTTTG